MQAGTSESTEDMQYISTGTVLQRRLAFLFESDVFMAQSPQLTAKLVLFFPNRMNCRSRFQIEAEVVLTCRGNELRR